MLPNSASSGPGDSGSTWASWDVVTLFPTGTYLILVTLVLTLASCVPGDSGSTRASPLTGDSDPKHGLTRPGDWFPMEPHLDLMSLVSPDPHQDLVSLVPTWVASGYGYTVH